MVADASRVLNDEAVALQAKFFSGLANPVRLRIVLELLSHERTVGDLVQAVGASQGHVSNQLACLRWCGYVQSRRAGRQTLYALRDDRIRAIVDLGRAVLADNAAQIEACARLEPVEAPAAATRRGVTRRGGPGAGTGTGDAVHGPE